jgi:hypothetical protein
LVKKLSAWVNINTDIAKFKWNSYDNKNLIRDTYLDTIPAPKDATDLRPVIQNLEKLYWAWDDGIGSFYDEIIPKLLEKSNEKTVLDLFLTPNGIANEKNLTKNLAILMRDMPWFKDKSDDEILWLIWDSWVPGARPLQWWVSKAKTKWNSMWWNETHNTKKILDAAKELSTVY